MRKNILTLILTIIYSSCNVPITGTLFLDRDIGLSKKKFAIVFYHDGDCSICYSVLDDLDKSFPNPLIVSVTHLKDTSLINFQFDRFSFKGYSIIDSSGAFYSNNMELLKEDRLFLINNKKEILVRELEYNSETKRVLQKHLYE